MASGRITPPVQLDAPTFAQPWDRSHAGTLPLDLNRDPVQIIDFLPELGTHE